MKFLNPNFYKSKLSPLNNEGVFRNAPFLKEMFEVVILLRRLVHKYELGSDVICWISDFKHNVSWEF